MLLTQSAWSPSIPKAELAGAVITYEESLWTFPLTLYIDFTISNQFMLGSDVWLNLNERIESRMTSNLFWAHLGVIIYPHKLFNLR